LAIALRIRRPIREEGVDVAKGAEVLDQWIHELAMQHGQRDITKIRSSAASAAATAVGIMAVVADRFILSGVGALGDRGGRNHHEAVRAEVESGFDGSVQPQATVQRHISCTAGEHAGHVVDLRM